jgi:hypothetical protein
MAHGHVTECTGHFAIKGYVKKKLSLFVVPLQDWGYARIAC